MTVTFLFSFQASFNFNLIVLFTLDLLFRCLCLFCFILLVSLILHDFKLLFIFICFTDLRLNAMILRKQITSILGERYYT